MDGRSHGGHTAGQGSTICRGTAEATDSEEPDAEEGEPLTSMQRPTTPPSLPPSSCYPAISGDLVKGQPVQPLYTY